MDRLQGWNVVLLVVTGVTGMDQMMCKPHFIYDTVGNGVMDIYHFRCHPSVQWHLPK